MIDTERLVGSLNSRDFFEIATPSKPASTHPGNPPLPPPGQARPFRPPPGSARDARNPRRGIIQEAPSKCAGAKSTVLAHPPQANLTSVSIRAGDCWMGPAAPLPASRCLHLLTRPDSTLSSEEPVRRSPMVGGSLGHAPASLRQSRALCPRTSRLQMGVTPSGRPCCSGHPHPTCI